MDIMAEDYLVKVMRVTGTYMACLVSVMIYDWLALLQKEWKYIWTTRFNVVSALYIFIRYFGLGVSTLSLYLVNASLNYQRCIPFAKFQVYASCFLTFAVSILLSLRLHGLYNHNVYLLGALLALAAGFLAINMVAGIQFSGVEYPNGAKGPCFCAPLPDSTDMKLTLALCPLLFTFVCTVLMIARFVVLRKQGARGGILQIVMRDGLIFFLVIFAANFIHLIFQVAADRTIFAVNGPMVFIVTCSSGCRLVLSLKEHGQKAVQSVTIGDGRHAFKSGAGRVLSPSTKPSEVNDIALASYPAQTTHINFTGHKSDADTPEDDGSQELVTPARNFPGIYVTQSSHVVVDEEKGM